jgi:hypothetical protein
MGVCLGAGAVLYRPVMSRHDRKLADELFLHGTKAMPGLPAVPPAGDRMTAAEEHIEKLTNTTDTLALSVSSLVKSLDALAGDIRTRETRDIEKIRGASD